MDYNTRYLIKVLLFRVRRRDAQAGLDGQDGRRTHPCKQSNTFCLANHSVLPVPFWISPKFYPFLLHGVKLLNMQDYLAANYCPTLNEDQQWCEEALSRYYVGALVTIFFLFFFLVNKVDVFVSFDPYHLPVCRCRALLCGWSNPCLSDRRRLWCLQGVSEKFVSKIFCKNRV